MYLAFDGINNNYEPFKTLKEAQEYLEECFFDRDEGYHPDLSTCKIYKLSHKIDYDIVADKNNYTDEEWKEEGYSLQFNEIWKHKFIEIK